MKTIHRLASFIILCAVALTAIASDAPARGGRYIIVLNSVRKGEHPLRDDDVRKLGGSVDGRGPWKLFVTLPPGAAEALRQYPGVRYVQGLDGVTSPAPPASIIRLRPRINQAPPTWSSGTYKYDGSGNIYAIGVAQGENGDGMATTYSYDLLSRLTKVDSVGSAANATGTARTENYSYDVYGNLTLFTVGDGVQRVLTVSASSNQYQTSPTTGVAATYDQGVERGHTFVFWR